MPAELYIAKGLYPWTLTLEDGSTRVILASSLMAAISGILPSGVVSVSRGVAYDPSQDPPPVLTAPLVPASAKIGDPNFTLHVHGTGFKATHKILWNGGLEPTTFVSATELTTLVNMATAQFPMAIPVAVQTLGGQVSNSLTFDLQPTAIE